AALGSKDGRALSAWALSLTRAGLSSRAVASALVEAAPLIGLNLALATGVYTARQVVSQVRNFIRTKVHEVLREQNELRRCRPPDRLPRAPPAGNRPSRFTLPCPARGDCISPSRRHTEPATGPLPPLRSGSPDPPGNHSHLLSRRRTWRSPGC